MKFYAAAIIMLMIGLAVAVVVTGEGEPARPAGANPPAQSSPSSDEKAMSTLKIN